MFLIFLLGWPFEWPAIMLVFLPIFLPVVEKLNFGLSKLDMLIWFGALVAVNLQTAFLSPPVAMSAYYLKNVVPQWSLSHDLQGHGRLHGDPDRVPARLDHVAADRALAAERTQIAFLRCLISASARSWKFIALQRVRQLLGVEQPCVRDRRTGKC